jgi:hypothetical protein
MEDVVNTPSHRQDFLSVGENLQRGGGVAELIYVSIEICY